MIKINKEDYLKILFILSIVTLVSALVIEYGFGYKPLILAIIFKGFSFHFILPSCVFNFFA